MRRIILITFGLTCVAVGFVGVVLPVLPTTPFLLLAVWAFARSSPRFQNWLETHEMFGPYIVNWRRYGVIPLRAKILALVMMTASFLWLSIFSDAGNAIVIAVGCILAAAAMFVITRPSTPAQALEDAD